MTDAHFISVLPYWACVVSLVRWKLYSNFLFSLQWFAHHFKCGAAGLIHELKIIYYLPVVIDDAPQFRWSNRACIVKSPGELFAYFVLNLFTVKFRNYYSWLANMPLDPISAHRRESHSSSTRQSSISWSQRPYWNSNIFPRTLWK